MGEKRRKANRKRKHWGKGILNLRKRHAKNKVHSTAQKKEPTTPPQGGEKKRTCLEKKEVQFFRLSILSRKKAPKTPTNIEQGGGGKEKGSAKPWKSKRILDVSAS